MCRYHTVIRNVPACTRSAAPALQSVLVGLKRGARARAAPVRRCIMRPAPAIGDALLFSQAKYWVSSLIRAAAKLVLHIVAGRISHYAPSRVIHVNSACRVLRQGDWKVVGPGLNGLTVAGIEGAALERARYGRARATDEGHGLPGIADRAAGRQRNRVERQVLVVAEPVGSAVRKHNGGQERRSGPARLLDTSSWVVRVARSSACVEGGAVAYRRVAQVVVCRAGTGG